MTIFIANLTFLTADNDEDAGKDDGGSKGEDDKVYSNLMNEGEFGQTSSLTNDEHR